MYATGTGSLPGTDMRGAVRHVLGSFEHAWLPELPSRGVGADMVGRASAMLDGLAVDLQPAGWRLVGNRGVDHERAISMLRRDLDDLEEAAQTFDGTVTITVCGPWTLVSLLERFTGDKVLADRGARRDVAQSLGSGVAQLLAEMRRRLPCVRFAVQLDEPLLPSVLTGTVPTASGFGRQRAVERPEATALLDFVVAPVRDEVERVRLHSCAPWPATAGLPDGGVDTDLLQRSGIDEVSLDARLLRGVDLDRLGPWMEAGRGLVLGLAPTHVPDAVSRPDAIVRRGLDLLRPLGMDPAVLQERVALSTACGLAGWSLRPAMAQLDALLEATPLLAERLDD